MKVEDCTDGEIKVLNIKPTASGWMEVLVDNKKADAHYTVFRDPEGIWRPNDDLPYPCRFERQEDYEKAFKKYMEYEKGL